MAKPKKITPKKVKAPEKETPAEVKKIRPEMDTAKENTDAEDEMDEEESEDEDEEEDEEAPAKLKSNAEKVDEESKPAGDPDYLQPYQYKKVNNRPTLGGPLTNPDAGSKAEKMKAFLLTQRRISILIPLDPGSDPKVPYSVTLNGYRLDFPCNTYLEVPEQIAEVVRNANDQTIAALGQFRIDGDSKKEGALQ